MSDAFPASVCFNPCFDGSGSQRFCGLGMIFGEIMFQSLF
ncbi:Uncharacterized protein dnm_098300 [Desulfonema magnum]|uniref:Uncharacterized protein n=1 Tax=Desulfonema magnum TaxID=45655 RepID=A0A975BXN3_9BACT|nr:Uncharacterized protein dnm_098300 [Desulfonema magnum]